MADKECSRADGTDDFSPGRTLQGVCIGLSEVISCATHNQLEDYLDGLLGCVQEVILSVTCPDFFAHHSID